METLKNKNLIIVNGKAGSGKSTFLVDISNSIKDKTMCFIDLEGSTISRLKLNDNIDVYLKRIDDFSIIDKIINKYEIIVNILLFILIGYLYIRLNLLYLNPLWSMFGYIPYRVNNDTILITNYKISELKIKLKNNQSIKGFYMANDIFIAKKEK